MEFEKKLLSFKTPPLPAFIIPLMLCLSLSCIQTESKNPKLQSNSYFDIISNTEKISLNGDWQLKYADTNSWKPVSVPSTYNTKERLKYQGQVHYKKIINLTEKQLKNTRPVIRFLGVALRCEIFINGEPAGRNDYGWIPFEMDITSCLRPGKNEILVSVNNTILEKAIPDTNWNGWWNYGGIFRDVYIDLRPKCSIQNIYTCTTQNESEWSLKAFAELINKTEKTKQVSINMRLQNCEEKTIWKSGKKLSLKPGPNTITLTQTFSDVISWSPENPTLYTLVCSLNDTHQVKIKTAFRDIKTRGAKILLNGKPLKIRGMNLHEEHPSYGNALPPHLIESTLNDIKSLNVNFLRTAHYTHHPYLYDLCDRKGLLVWTEIPAWKSKTRSLNDPDNYQKYGAGQIKAMIEQYRKHPAIVIWSIGNEFKSDQYPVRNYVQKTAELVKSIDPSRLATFASDKHRSKQDINAVPDKCLELVDIISLNEYYGWYYGADNDLGPKLDRIHCLYPEKPIVISETGCGAAPDINTQRQKQDPRKDYSLNHQCEYLRSHLNQVYDPARSDYVAGAMIWAYADFRDPHRTGSTHPTAWKSVNLKGIVSIDRQRKPSYRTIKDFYKALTE